MNLRYNFQIYPTKRSIAFSNYLYLHWHNVKLTKNILTIKRPDHGFVWKIFMCLIDTKS